jgi:hypothetical protein
MAEAPGPEPPAEPSAKRKAAGGAEHGAPKRAAADPVLLAAALTAAAAAAAIAAGGTAAAAAASTTTSAPAAASVEEVAEGVVGFEPAWLAPLYELYGTRELTDMAPSREQQIAGPGWCTRTPWASFSAPPHRAYGVFGAPSYPLGAPG